MGIGLALARRLVEMHGGTIEAHGERRGRGSAFTVSLPLVPEVVSEAVTGAGLVTTFAHKVRVVDDNRDSAETTAALLECLGAEVEILFDGRDVLKSVREEGPSVVFLDLGMLHMDGYEVARQTSITTS